MYEQWAQLTNHIVFDGSNYTDQTYPADREPLIGTLTVKLDNGYTSVIPHYELLSYERGTDSQGKYTVLNASRVMSAVESGEGDLGVNVPLLGGVFLSQNYLRIDYGQGKFWLAKAITTSSTPSNIKTTCEPVSSGPASTDDSSSSAGNADIGLKVGLPVAFVVAALVIFAWWLFKRQGYFRGLDKNLHQDRFSPAFSFSASPRPVNVAEVEPSDVASPARKPSELESQEEMGIVDHSTRRVSELQGNGVTELETPLSSPVL
jgi:hypothetical protein